MIIYPKPDGWKPLTGSQHALTCLPKMMKNLLKPMENNEKLIQMLMLT